VVAELGGLSLSDQEQLDASISVGYRLEKYGMLVSDMASINTIRKMTSSEVTLNMM
jgi:hypothetical protein